MNAIGGTESITKPILPPRRTAVDYGGTTGADVMKAQMRQRVLLWGGAIVVGILLIVAGFVVR